MLSPRCGVRRGVVDRIGTYEGITHSISESTLVLLFQNWPILRLSYLFLSSGGVSAVKEPDHYEVKTFSTQITRMYFFPHKSRRPFLVVALKTQAANAVSSSK